MNLNTKTITLLALCTAIICILGPLSISIGPIPLSLGLFAVFLLAYILEKKSVICIILYLIIGLIGLPVFSGFSGGAMKLLGLTGGYLLSYPLCAYISALFIKKFDNYKLHFLGMVLGLIACYMFGTIYFCFVGNAELAYALKVCVIPFIIPDLIKIVLAILIGSQLKKRLK